MRFQPAALEAIRDRLPISQVVGASIKLKKAGRNYSGLCPFHKEKTPSFTCDDQRATFKCFGCGEGGDVFAFVQKKYGLTFPEAVERLAADAGVPLPKADAETVKREARKLSLIEVVEHASKFFSENLAGDGEGAQARDYLQARSVLHASVGRFGIGLANSSAEALAAYLEKHGVDLYQAREAGLLRQTDDGAFSRASRFRSRVIFPIRDLKGRVVGFGGRALGDAKPKYLNSPESPIFDKGSLLYNADRARAPAWDGATVVALEGYMDVVASDAAGFPASVGTMGTSITDGQLLSLWRLSDTPVICLDGDSAGQRAAGRVVKQALPLLKPGRTLRFALMPAGLDPDDVIRKRGPESYRGMIEAAVALPDMLWRSSASGKMLGTPDARAKLAADIEALVALVPDPDIRSEYRRDMRDRLRALPSRPRMLRANGGTYHSANPASQRLVHGIDLSGITLKEAITVAAMVASPSAALNAIESVSMDERLSPAAREAVGKIGAILAGLDDGADVVAALKAAGMASTIEAAYAKVHSAGILSLEPGGSGEAAAAILERRH